MIALAITLLHIGEAAVVLTGWGLIVLLVILFVGLS